MDNKQKEQAKLRMQRMRNKQRNKGAEGVTQTPDNVTQDVTQYRPIMYALADPIMRGKLRAICESLSGRHTGKQNYLGDVWYGCGGGATSFLEIDELLTALP